MAEKKKEQKLRDTQLNPDRHPQTELFLCDISDAILKQDMASMEHPIFSLSKKRDTTTKHYEDGNGNTLEITPSTLGHATIYDKDILIFAISQIMAAKNEGRAYSREVGFDARDVLIFTNRATGGMQYRGLEQSLKRLKGTMLTTNIKTGNETTSNIFGLIESATVRRETKDGKVLEWGVTLSEWLMRAIEANEVLTLPRDYFRLSRPLERRIYEIARKHSGMKKSGWRIGLDKLQNKCGSSSPRRHFKDHIQRIAEYDHLPDYSVVFDEEDRMVFFFPRPEFLESVKGAVAKTEIPSLKPTTYDKFRKLFRYKDPHFYEQDWRDWASTKPNPPDNPDAAFLAFAKKRILSEMSED